VRARAARAGDGGRMRIGFAIGQLELSPETRRRIDRDAWLLIAWWAVVGLACNALLRELAGVRSPPWRYPLTAAAMCAFGIVLGLRAWLALFARAVRATPRRWRVVSEQERASDRPRPWRPVAGAAPVAAVSSLLYLAAELIGSFDAGRIALTILLVMVGVFAVLGLLTYKLPVTFSWDALMAELALRFVFGRSVGRAILPHLPEAESWPVIVRETWPHGVSLLVFCAALGVAMVLVHPGAVSLADFFR